VFDTIGGLPVHPLVVHAVVVLGPLAALLAVLYAVKPAWRVALKWPTLLLALGAAGSAALATASGESLEELVEGGGTEAARSMVEEHAEAGDLAAVSLYVLLGIVVVSLFFLIPARKVNISKAMSTLALVLCVAGALGVAVATFNAGHTGATATWGDTVSDSGGGGDDDAAPLR
jgi:Predicted membrane protein (DUF2231)